MTALVRRLAVIAGLACTAIGQVSAQSSGSAPLALVPQALETQVEINDYVELRATAQVIRLEPQRPAAEPDPESHDLEFKNLGTFVDVRPFRNSFVISGGLYTGDKTRGDLAYSHNAPVVTRESAASPTGTLQLAVKGEKLAPFVGFGFDSTHRQDRRVGMKVMAGAIFSGTPDVTMMSPGGPLSGDAIVLEQLERERQRFEEGIDTGDVHPVVQLGLTYRF
ncbi:hypothetical protein [Henriciella mobilis]|uniref:Outer membrane protein beta-barrel domain-containing protein n=1 Tax=Henriciella mobilis TaxID=2305467 RepID=A0A399RMX0_9PROT|nr:hypothetical protein [Henriciella mobilis]RIJ16080.1 hypothetical protein D1231_09835 [Henriciella mobilis]RIJ23008.1 hypothetical protein D1227_05765 [Henriciella mobilis]RIJ32548.1 hypothetical protein D1223_01460 [Henriciella mobilis]